VAGQTAGPAPRYVQRGSRSVTRSGAAVGPSVAHTGRAVRATVGPPFGTAVRATVRTAVGATVLHAGHSAGTTVGRTFGAAVRTAVELTGHATRAAVSRAFGRGLVV
jgi:hypothetical protein